MQVVYKLWEGSWADDAVVEDRARGVFANLERVRRVQHDGPFYQLDAMHLCEPSPQRTPLLYQAGGSEMGRAFAARNAKCLLIAGSSKEWIVAYVKDMRRRAVEAERQAEDLKIFAIGTPVVDDTRAEAEEKLADYRHYVRTEGALAQLSGAMGIDLAQFDPDTPVSVLAGRKTDATQTALKALARASGQGDWTNPADGRVRRYWRADADVCGLRRRGGRGTDRLDGRDRHRRHEPGLCGDAGNIRRGGGQGSAGIAEPGPVQDSVC